VSATPPIRSTLAQARSSASTAARRWDTISRPLYYIGVTPRLIRREHRTKWQLPADVRIGGPSGRGNATGRVSTAIKDHMNPRSSSDTVEPHSRREPRLPGPMVVTARELHVTAQIGSAIG